MPALTLESEAIEDIKEEPKKKMKAEKKIYNCKQCDQEFNHKGTYKAHLKSHSGKLYQFFENIDYLIV